MYYGDKTKAIETKIKALRDAAGLYSKIAPVITAFDGKCYNCRFENAIRDAAGAFCKKETCGAGYYSIYYYDRGDVLTLATLNIEDMQDGKRINSADFLESLRNHRAELLRRAADIEKAAADIETIRARIEAEKKVLDSIINPIPYYIRDLYGIEARVRCY